MSPVRFTWWSVNGQQREIGKVYEFVESIAFGMSLCGLGAGQILVFAWPLMQHTEPVATLELVDRSNASRIKALIEDNCCVVVPVDSMGARV